MAQHFRAFSAPVEELSVAASIIPSNSQLPLITVLGVPTPSSCICKVLHVHGAHTYSQVYVHIHKINR